MNITIHPLHVPDSLDAPDAADFLAMVACGNDQWSRDSGLDGLLDEDPLDLLTQWHNTVDYTKVGLLARAGDDAIGFGAVEYGNETDHTAEVWVELSAAAEKTDAHDLILSRLESIAREHGRTTLSLYSVHPVDQHAERLPSPTGSGSIPRDDRAERLLRNGFCLQQVERLSSFDLTGSFDEVQHLLDEALRAAGPDYRVVSWIGRTPDEYVDGYAAILQRLSTDIPSGDLEIEAQRWDAARVRRREDRLERAGREIGVALVIHTPTGDVAAFNDLVAAADRSRPTEQYGTLVTPEHRGHKLGSIVKCAGLIQWRSAMPQCPSIITWNAEENRFMLDVNERVGFRPVACSGAWEKKLV
ncbi:GNAT family N-acetyltransferase [Microbacterium amylolyticum]|uniref:GNAT superfamily N-acetyltransferase n=1 Tax=Microbacterium amylolyticum TaxID=936337 RepID=A0ABS4ZEX4_9MICO|nr:GNAT family N-acetyltransferase [Microbacterium amylolyticum]MBP2435838.1 GNAT superfamily N-acetyltransferase [Microbacterium amylolyticum]